jgi:uncharacterized repeat protein (TIGR01451 family)
MPSKLSAQTNQYTNTTTGNIVDSTNCATTVTRTFAVGTSYTVSNVTLGVLLSHTYRSDLRITLTSPSGTSVQVMTNVGGAADNLNVLFDDDAPGAISGHTANDTTGSVPPYLGTFQPTAALSAFDGQNAFGNWTMVICDSVAQDTGTFSRADLYITQQPTNFADLSLAKTVSNANPANGATISYTLTASNTAVSNMTATGVTVLDILPPGVNFVSASGTGNYSAGTGIWTVGSLAPGASANITITVTVNATSGAVVTNETEIANSSAPDPDSTPNNSSVTEDDDASVSFTVSGTPTAGTPPTLVCPVGSTAHDWDAITWSAGTTSGSYALTAIGTMNFNIAISGGVFLNNATFGGQSPTRQNVVTGGLVPAQFSIFELVDMTSRSGVVTNTITLPTAVPGVQFRLFDIDYNAGQFADRVTVTGTFNGSPVTPTLTNGSANYVIGNSAYGNGTSADTSANGNVVVTFASPVDTIVIVYGNHNLAPVDPGQQAIAIHDMTFCRPQANLSVTKISTVVSDGVSATNAKAVSGALIRYCILVSNPGSGTATNVGISDVMPLNTTYVPGSIVTGTNCGSATTAEDDDATGADESDPYGVSFTGTTLTGTTASLGPSAGFAIAFNATVN